jgi:hypothetical protein
LLDERKDQEKAGQREKLWNERMKLLKWSTSSMAVSLQADHFLRVQAFLLS